MRRKRPGTVGTLTLTAVGDATRSTWEDVVATDPNALVSQTPTWLDCVCTVGGYEDATRAYRTPDGRTIVLPLARRRRLPPGARDESSMPFGWGTGGPISTGGRLSLGEVGAIATDIANRPNLVTTVKPSASVAGTWADAVPRDVVRTAHMTQTVDISAGFDDVWSNRFTSKVRSASRKAERRGVRVEVDDAGRLVPVFDSLYRRAVARWAEQQHEPRRLAEWRATRRDPPDKFRVVAERLDGACRVWVAWHAGEPVAAIMVLSYGAHSVYWRGAMDKDLAAGTGANELLHRLAVEHACEAGRRYYNMGDSAPGSSLARFKRTFGAEDWLYSSYRFERLPISTAEAVLRRQVKRVVGFRD